MSEWNLRLECSDAWGDTAFVSNQQFAYIDLMRGLAFSPFVNGADDPVVTSLMLKEFGDPLW